MQFFMYVCMIFISWIGAKEIVVSGNDAALGMTTGDLTALLSYATQILMSLMMLSMVFVMITMSLASARRIAEILNEKTDIQNSDSPVMAVKDGSISFENVDFVYASKADKKVLDHEFIFLKLLQNRWALPIRCECFGGCDAKTLTSKPKKSPIPLRIGQNRYFQTRSKTAQIPPDILRGILSRSRSRKRHTWHRETKNGVIRLNRKREFQTSCGDFPFCRTSATTSGQYSP